MLRLRHSPAHELREDPPHVAGERRVGHTRLLELHDVVVVAVDLAHESDGRRRGAREVRRVDADHGSRAGRVEERHHPGDDPAPVVPDEDGPLDADRVEQADEIARQVMDVVGLHG